MYAIKINRLGSFSDKQTVICTGKIANQWLNLTSRFPVEEEDADEITDNLLKLTTEFN